MQASANNRSKIWAVWLTGCQSPYEEADCEWLIVDYSVCVLQHTCELFLTCQGAREHLRDDGHRGTKRVEQQQWT